MYKMSQGTNDIQISLSYLNRQYIDIAPLKICFNVYYNSEFECFPSKLFLWYCGAATAFKIQN